MSNRFIALKKKIEYIGDKKSAPRYKTDNLNSILFKLEGCFNRAAEEKPLHKACGKLQYPHPFGEGVLDIKDEINARAGLGKKSATEKNVFKSEFREKHPKVSQYINDYRFKKVQKNLRVIAQDIQNPETSNHYDKAELIADFNRLEECFNDAVAKGWNSKFAMSFRHSVISVGQEIARLDPIGKMPFRYISNVFDKLESMD